MAPIKIDANYPKIQDSDSVEVRKIFFNVFAAVVVYTVGIAPKFSKKV